MEIIKTKSDLKKTLNYEKQFYQFKDKFSFGYCSSEKKILWKYVRVLRKTEYYHNTNKKLLLLFSRIRKKRLENKYKILIPINVCDIGLRINHLGVIRLSAEKIGKNCTIAGSAFCIKNGFKEGNPIIGDNCFIGMNSILIGPIQIGDNCLIGAGSVVTKSFESNCIIAKNPAVIIKKRD